jgi:hypothetical protein
MCISAPPTAALCRCLPARLRRLQATMQFEPIIILSSILAVVQIILTMLPGVYYTRQVRSSSETHAMHCRRAASVPRLSLPASRRPTGSSPALPNPCPPTRRARSTPPSGAGSAAWPSTCCCLPSCLSTLRGRSRLRTLPPTGHLQ